MEAIIDTSDRVPEVLLIAFSHTIIETEARGAFSLNDCVQRVQQGSGSKAMTTKS